MSFDEYVNHISQKYRLAVAISVIKSKPNDLSVEEYLAELQRKINIESDPNETVCSDDFNFEEDFGEGNQPIVLENADNYNNVHLKSNKTVHIENEDSQMSETILKNIDFDKFGLREVENQKSVLGNSLCPQKPNEGMMVEDQPNINQLNSSQLTFCESQFEINSTNATFCCSAPNAELILKNPNNVDSQETQLYTLHGFTQDYSYISQTQENLFSIPDKYIRGKSNKEQDSQYIQLDNDKTIVTADIENSNLNKKALDNESNENTNETFEDIQNKCKELSKGITESQSMNKHRENVEIIEEDVDIENDSDDAQTVKVPFKVLEELNKVRSYLNKKERGNTEGYSTDSGYRSDSQTRCSFRTSSQYSELSCSWLNQSAHSLFSYIVQAPVASDDISNEVAQVLGQLIDKLHDEENYPSFLEELLDTVNNLIRAIHEGGTDEGNILLTKDENIYRLILLNKSKHILRHTIENITNILETLHTNLTQENLYELTNIAEMENICYIFHVLEIFLKRYMKIKNASGQMNSQISQEDNILTKRSSLTDVWRKKWNPNYKEITKVQENVTVCVVKRCSDILNKIIVECMDGYSLVAYAALQCSNLIQS